MPKVSVIIPTYNRARLIGRAVGSVLAQTFRDFEVIIVDDGSTDHTRDAVQKIQCGNPQGEIKYFFQKNQGPAAARNFGIEKSSGEFIAFLDSDDEWKAQKLEQQVRFLDAHPNKSRIGIVFSDFTQIVNGNVVYERFLKRDFYERLFAKDINRLSTLLESCFIIPSIALVPAKVFHDVGAFDPSLIVVEDYELFIRIGQKYKIAFIDEVLVNRHMQGDNLISCSQTHCQHTISLFRRLLSADGFSRNERRVMRRRLLNAQYDLARHYFNERIFVKAREGFSKVLFSRYFFSAVYFLFLSVLPNGAFRALKAVKNYVRLVFCSRIIRP